MRLSRYIPSALRQHLRQRALAFVQREEVRKLLDEFEPIADREKFVSGRYVDLLRTLATIRACLPPHPRVLLDVGANEGDFTRAALALLGIDRAICFEPDADLNPAIRRGIDPSRLVVHNVALADRVGRDVFFVHPVKAMNSLLTSDAAVIGEKFHYDAAGIVQREVDVDTLDGVLSRSPGEREVRYLLKLDTQGNELEVLKGATVTLSRTDACLIEFMFCTPYERLSGFDDLINLMRERRFTCKGALTVMRRPSHEVSGVDFLFVHDEVAATAG